MVNLSIYLVSLFAFSNRETGALCAMKEVQLLPDDPKSAECIKQLEQVIPQLLLYLINCVVRLHDLQIKHWTQSIKKKNIYFHKGPKLMFLTYESSQSLYTKPVGVTYVKLHHFIPKHISCQLFRRELVI